LAVKPRGSVPEGAAPVSDVVATLADGKKVKHRTLFMRACNEKDEKGKLCCGHLKRWSDPGEELKAKLGANAEIYRCERCHTLYLPAPGEAPRTRIQSY
jgi:hypothetical protein